MLDPGLLGDPLRPTGEQYVSSRFPQKNGIENARYRPKDTLHLR